MGEFFDADDPFHNFVEECMERKNVRGREQAVVQDEFRECVQAWNRAKDRLPIEDVDEEELAEEFLTGRRS